MGKKLNTRAAAAKLSWQIIDKGQSLDSAITQFFDDTQWSPQDRGFVQELVYGVCRWYGELNAIAETLLNSPIRNKDRVIHFVLLVGLYQLHKLDTAQHAAVDETVSACRQLNKQWSKKLINGCLRQFLRRAADDQQNFTRFNHPKWMSDAIQNAWPSHIDEILAANDQRPPMCIRVNSMQDTRDTYLAKLNEQNIVARKDAYAKDGLILEQAVPVNTLPGFHNGACSVQDTAAQIAADLLLTTTGMTVLDACAAPGGKTAHLLERADNQLIMDALDISEKRCERLSETIQRLQLAANIYAADATNQPSWDVPKNGYDRILIDAPCSGLGVIRRHPDIKHHRQPSDIEALQQTQAALLNNLWGVLKPGGQLLYMTCSILPDENERQIERFVANQNDVMLIDTSHPNALALQYGVQTLPGVHGMDGFYYCLLQKKNSDTV